MQVIGRLLPYEHCSAFRGSASMQNAVTDMQVVVQTTLCILVLKIACPHGADLSTAFDLHCYIDCMLKVLPMC